MNEVDKKISNNTNEMNKSISCTVTDCKNHCKNKDYCSLKKIEIEAHKADPKACENVDCKSFEKDF